MSERNNFETRTSGHDEWLTPRYITDALGPFDLDPCSPINRPWDTAKNHYTVIDNGLSINWDGYVWCNPPYGVETYKWMKKLSNHNNGIAFIFARTETRNFKDNIWDKATSVLFLEKRVKFYDVNGQEAKSTAGCPSVLVSYGNYASDKLFQSNIENLIKGKYLKLK